jgi:DNA-directed RNA polymerase subunit M/transcription elongation factor TFIIS
MALIQFTANHSDHSNSSGFQFEFHCDRCGNGHMSRFQSSSLGVATGLLHAAGSIFGGLLGRAADGADHLNDALRSKGRDDAFAAAVQEAKQAFRHCKRCGKWVCPEACWNESRQLCEECAPDLAEETAAAQAQAAREQVHEKARATHLVKDVDMSREATAHCPGCGARAGSAKFCPECGQALNPKVQCPACDAEMEAQAKFCPECGHKR